MPMSMRDALYHSDDPNETTFKYDETMPAMPVPNLDDTVKRLLDSMKPIAKSQDDFERAKQKAYKFLKEPRVLAAQQAIIDSNATTKNYIEKWWLEYAYLRSRKPLSPYSNMGAPMPFYNKWPEIDPNVQDDTCKSRRIALTTYFSLCFWKLLLFEKMRPMIHKGVPWTMNQFKYLFTTTRRPGKDIDSVYCTFESTSSQLTKPPLSQDMMVMHKGYIFLLDAVLLVKHQDSYSICIRPAGQIEKQFNYIYEYCKNLPYGPSIGALTTLDRSEWAEARDQLMNLSKQNKNNLERIESTLNAIVLDETTPVTHSEIQRECFFGDAANRWTDKSLQIIIFKNGLFGASAEHTNMDGFCTSVLTNYIVMSIRECEGLWKDEYLEDEWALVDEAVRLDIPMPEILHFDLNRSITEQIKNARERFHALEKTVGIIHITSPIYSKEFGKNYKIHPEALVQCAIHLTYFKMHGSIAPTYVTASTRNFYNGRTETCRSCTMEMLDFCMTFSGKGDDNSKMIKLEAACANYCAQMKEASSGRGFDRHMLVLYFMMLLQNESGVDQIELFEDPLFQECNKFILSTSCAGYWNVCGGVPPLVEDGYGLFYGIGDEEITICNTSYVNDKTDVHKFYNNLCMAFKDIKEMVSKQKSLAKL